MTKKSRPTQDLGREIAKLNNHYATVLGPGAMIEMKKPRVFWKAIFRPLLHRILARVGEFSGQEVKILFCDLYSIALTYVVRMNERSFHLKVESDIRLLRETYGSVLTKVRQSISLVRNSEDTLKKRGGLRKNSPAFTAAHKALSELDQYIRAIESSLAAIIHPRLRTKKEGELAKTFAGIFNQVDVPLTPQDKSLRDDLLLATYHRVEKFTATSGKGQTRAFTREFGKTLGVEITEQAFKMLLLRSRRESGASPAPNQ